MNRIDVEKTMEVLGFNTIVGDIMTSLKTAKAYLLKDCIAYHSYDGCVYVNGRIPLEFANILWEKYYDSSDIIICNAFDDIDGTSPRFSAIDGIYKDRVAKINKQNLGIKKRALLLEKEKQELYQRSDDKKYMPNYIIKSTDALVTFLTEMTDYYAAKEGYFSIESKKHSQYLREIFAEVLKELNLKMSIESWVKNTDRSYLYDKSIQRLEKTDFGRKFKKALKNFDNAVNPYQDSNFDFANIETYINNVDISGVPYSDASSKRRNCVTLVITDKNTKNFTLFERDPNGFSYELQYNTDTANYVVSHYFNPQMYERTNSGNDRLVDEGEVIQISKTCLNEKDNIDITYNVSHDTVLSDKKYNRYVAASDEDRALVYDVLLTAAELASNVTYDNMKKGVQKKLI